MGLCAAGQRVSRRPRSSGPRCGEPAGWSSMVDARWSQGEADGTVFGYLGVKISGTDVWTTGRGTPSRCLGPLIGACAGVVEPRRSWMGTFSSSALLGDVPPKNARLYVAFAD